MGKDRGPQQGTPRPSPFGGSVEDIYKQLKQLDEQHVRAVRGLEKLAKALDHVRTARGELDDLAGDETLTPSLSDLPEQLKAVEDALVQETWRVRAYITDVE